MKAHLKILLALCLFPALQLQAQRIYRTVPTILDMLATRPSSFAMSPIGTNATFFALVETSGDTVAGAGKRTWWWNSTSTAPTNAIGGPGGPGPFAWPTDSTNAGRWLRVPDASLFVDGVFGDIARTNGGLNWRIVPRAVTPQHMPALANHTFWGRASAGSGDAEQAMFGTGFSWTGNTVNLDTNLIVPINIGMAHVRTYADLLAATSAPGHVSAYMVDEYWEGTGFGGGIWTHNPMGDYTLNRAISAAYAGGQIQPHLPLQKIDITRFGALHNAPTNITDPGVYDAWMMCQDRTILGSLYAPMGNYNIWTGFKQKPIGTAKGWLFNGAQSIGTMVIPIKSGSGTFLVGDSITSGSHETNAVYRIKASTSTNITIAWPGLRVAMADNAPIQVLPAPRMVIEGVNHGIQQDPYERAQYTSNFIMIQDDVPIITAEGDHGSVKYLSLSYDNFQPNTATNAIAIFNPGGSRLYQWEFEGISFLRAARNVYVAPTTNKKTAANNSFKKLIMRSASLQGFGFYKSGTDNCFDHFYVQNNGYTSSGISHLQSFTNAYKSGTLLALDFPVLPGMIGQGSFGELTLSGGFGGAYCVKLVSNNIVYLDTVSGLSGASLGTNTQGSFETQAKTQSILPQMYTAPGCQFAASDIDIEVNIGSTNGAVPVAWDNSGNGGVVGLHLEYFRVEAPNQAIVRNRGGQLSVMNGYIVNSGRRASDITYVFVNDTEDLGPSGNKGNIVVSNFSFRDLSSMQEGSGAWVASTNLNGTAPVLFLTKPATPPSQRANTASVPLPGSSKVAAVVDLVF